MKFGGTSVEDAAAISRLVEIVGRRVDKKPLIVVSALSGVTSLQDIIPGSCRRRFRSCGDDQGNKGETSHSA